MRIVYPDLSEVRTEFRIQNGLRETAVTDPLGRTKTSFADATGNIVRMVQTREGTQVSTEYSYNTLHEITQVLDADGNPTTIEFDLLGRRTSVTTPDAGLTEYRYDGAGRLYRKIDASLREKGKWIEYGYEYARLASITYPDTGAGGAVTYTYGTNDNRNINATGRLLAVENKMSLIRYEYGKLGETVKTTKTLKLLRGINESYTGVMEYGYDYLGRVQSVTYPDGEILRYGYGRGGEVKTVTGARDGLTAQYVKLVAYDEFGQRAFLRYGNDVTTEYSYHPTRRWLERIRTVSAGGKVFQDMTYTFDKVGNIRRTENKAAGKTITQEYNYDDLNQLVYAHGTYSDRSRGGETVHGYTQRFEYDIIGNMFKKTSAHTLTPGRSRTDLNYTLDYAYQKARPHCAVTIGDSTYEYDPNGNVTEEVYANSVSRTESERGSLSGPAVDTDDNRGHITVGPEDWADDEPEPGTVLRSFIWDEENRMTEAVAGNEHVYFAYDAAGERTLKYSEHGETVYVDRMYQVETNQAPKLYTKHIFIGETRLISRVGGEGQAYGGQDGEIYYYHADHLGNTTWVTDNQGAEYEHIEYCPYGESWVNEGRDSLNRINYMFTSKELDAETGLYYFGARYLDPKTSRWMSTDPAMEKYLPAAGKGADGLPGMGGVYNAVNLVTYHYAGNNPLKYVDPKGSDTKDPPATRKLSVYEECFIRGAIGDTYLGQKIDYSAITLVNTNCEFRGEFTAPGFIFCNTARDYLRDRESQALLIHEVFHQFQYQTDPRAFQNLIREQALGKANNGIGIQPNPYDYGDISKINNLFDIKTYEGQGQFIEDFILNIGFYLEAVENYNKHPKDSYAQFRLNFWEEEIRKRAQILKNPYGNKFPGMKSDCIDEFTK